MLVGVDQYSSITTVSIQDEWRHFVAGGAHKPKELENPAPEWISERSWNEILTLGSLSKFVPFVDDFKNHLEGYKSIFDSSDPQR